MLAARNDKETVESADFDEAIDRVVAGLQKKSRVMNAKEKEIVAFHESGHAIVAESVEYADPVHKISIIPRGISALGYTQQQPTEDRYLMTRSELLDRLAVLLGGRVAEELVFYRNLHRSPKRFTAGLGHCPGHGHGIRHERFSGIGEL